MFMFKASTILNALTEFAPEILQICQKALAQSVKDLDFIRLDAEVFAKCPSDSIDYAVMEKTENAVLVPLQSPWSDIGSWSALWEIGDKDENGNVVKGDVISHNTKDCYLYSPDRLLATVGIENLVVIDTADAVLVADSSQTQAVKNMVEQLKSSSRNEFNQHRRVYRPWGNYDTVDIGFRFQVKRITVNPHAQLSLQKHHHRAEHWIIVKGCANVTSGEKTFILYENESTYIPQGTVHRLENPGKIALELIEIQTGSYLGEDDIERFEDNYGRN